MKKYIFIMFSITMLLLSACSKEEDKKLMSLDELSQASWDTVVSQAKEEGDVSWFVWYLQANFREIAKDFTDTYGITVLIPEGTLDANSNKLIAEKNRDVGDIDVLSFGTDSALLKMDDVFFGPLDFIPNKAERVTNLANVDTNGYAYAYWGNQTGFAYDPKRINEKDLPQTLDELEAWFKKNPKLFALNDPNGGGSGTSFIRSVIVNKTKVDYNTTPFSTTVTDKWQAIWDWFNQNKEYYGITASNADSLTRLSDGEFIIVPAWEDHMANLQKQGAISKDLKFYIPKFGMAGGGNVAAIPKNAPHPAAALVFLEWLTSAKTQTSFNKIMGAAPQNAKADDSYALASNEMRVHSTTPLPSEYEVEIKKQFIEKVLLK